MPYQPDRLGAACGGGPAAHELCGADLGRFRAALGGAPVLVTCTQEAATFRAAQTDLGDSTPLTFANIREAAGWSDEAAAALPKIAALVALATAAPDPQPPTVTQQSGGTILIYGRDEQAPDAAEQLRDQLDVTVMLTGEEPVLPINADYPVVRGVIRRAGGHLGAFELTVDRFAPALPSSRAAYEFGPARDGATSRCDLILDLTGGTPLMPAPSKRDGYLRPDPGDAVAVQRAIGQAAGLTGVFDKPRTITAETALCAHARNGQTGCTRCLDVCPAGAILPAGDGVAVDPHVCAGCGACVAVCPTTALRWSQSSAAASVERLRRLLLTYRANAADQPPVLLIHDISHGARLIEALARAGDGLPARVLPVCEPRVVGLDYLASAIAYGAAEVRLLTGRGSPQDRDALVREVELVEALLQGLGFGAGRVALLETDDPFELGAALRALPPRPPAAAAAFITMGDKREITMQALNALLAAAPTPAAPAFAVPLPRGAPIGQVAVADGCTLCLSCVSVCPTAALRDGGDRPALLFVEDNCVQCGLCAATCPEQVITLEPRATFGPARRAPVLLREEAPALCVSCGKPFGVAASIDRVAAKLVGKHWMFSDPAVIARLRMCGDCRVIAQTRHGLDPYAGPPRPLPRTSDDPTD